ncbi:MAG TPA: hypothetical protein VJ583_03925 [Nitrososphaeraceae archaeon]|nr:hypothetical protein [Nitrososphaeraceae archaeon]
MKISSYYCDGTKIFRTTEKGLNFLKMHSEMVELLQKTTIGNDNDKSI